MCCFDVWGRVGCWGVGDVLSMTLSGERGTRQQKRSQVIEQVVGVDWAGGLLCDEMGIVKRGRAIRGRAVTTSREGGLW